MVGVEFLDGLVNKNLFCVKGKFVLYKFVGLGDCLMELLIKWNGIFEFVFWEEVLMFVLLKFNEIKVENGLDVFVGFLCFRVINEDNYVF